MPETTRPIEPILRQTLGALVHKVEEFRSDLAVTVSRQAWVQAATLLRDHTELDFQLFQDLGLLGVGSCHVKQLLVIFDAVVQRGHQRADGLPGACASLDYHVLFFG